MAEPRVVVAPGPRRQPDVGQEFATIGHLYRGIEAGLRDLVARLGERAVFVGSPRGQATAERFHWPKLIAAHVPAELRSR